MTEIGHAYGLLLYLILLQLVVFQLTSPLAVLSSAPAALVAHCATPFSSRSAWSYFQCAAHVACLGTPRSFSWNCAIHGATSAPPLLSFISPGAAADVCRPPPPRRHRSSLVLVVTTQWRFRGAHQAVQLGTQHLCTCAYRSLGRICLRSLVLFTSGLAGWQYQ